LFPQNTGGVGFSWRGRRQARAAVPKMEAPTVVPALRPVDPAAPLLLLTCGMEGRRLVSYQIGCLGHNNVDSTDWCDENLSVVCEIFADEVDKGNRANTHFSKIGYKNVIQKFKDRIGLLYTRRQFKNKWDKLKQDYRIWKQLVMIDAWWKKTTRVCLIACPFEYRIVLLLLVFMCLDIFQAVKGCGMHVFVFG
jgi:hypothetical protein